MALIDNLVAYYKLNAAGVTADAHGANTLTNTNSVTTTTGKLGEAAVFTAASSQSLSATIAELDAATQATIAGWFYRTSTGHFVSVGTRASGTQRFGILISTDGNVYFTCAAGVQTYIWCANTVAVDTWGHFAITYNMANANPAKSKAYINGDLKTVTMVGGTTPSALATNANQGPLYIGRETGTLYSTGRIDEVGVWNRELTGTEVAQLYNAGYGMAYPLAAARIRQTTNAVMAGAR
jgi:hypothetical protein